MFQYITFRGILSVVLSLVIAVVIGKRIICLLKKKMIGETVRDLGLAGEQQKKGTPTMGGLIILLAIIVPTLLLADLTKVYIQLMLLSTVWLGVIGFVDDYLKIQARRRASLNGEKFEKKNSDGLAGIAKLIGQVALGVIVGTVLYFNDDVIVERKLVVKNKSVATEVDKSGKPNGQIVVRIVDGEEKRFVRVKEPITTIPFVKNHEFNYTKLISWLGDGAEDYTWIIYILAVTFIITAVSNGANITDGLDGLTAGISAIVAVGLGIFAYISGNFMFSEYLNIVYIPELSELSIFIGALTGACIGFLWYNAYPAQVFMGDTGSLPLGGIIATLSIIIRKEILVPIFCGVFLIELISVVVQVSYFKYTKRKFGEGKRVFLMSPLHHHFQKKGLHESKIVVRFWIVTVLLVIISILTLKVR